MSFGMGRRKRPVRTCPNAADRIWVHQRQEEAPAAGGGGQGFQGGRDDHEYAQTLDAKL